MTATDADRARQRQEWQKAVSNARHAQRANRWRRKPARAGAGMVRVTVPGRQEGK